MLSLLIAATFCLSPGDNDLIWVEGEAAKTREVGPKHGWYNSIKTELLSGGDWVSNFGDKDGIVTYDVPVKAAGTYTLWVRANPIAAALAWKLATGSGRRSIPGAPRTRSTWRPTTARTCATSPG
jgi:hypothetical protein